MMKSFGKLKRDHHKVQGKYQSTENDFKFLVYKNETLSIFSRDNDTKIKTCVWDSGGVLLAVTKNGIVNSEK